VKVEHEIKLDKTEMSMIVWISGFTLKENENAELRKLFGIELAEMYASL